MVNKKYRRNLKKLLVCAMAAAMVIQTPAAALADTDTPIEVSARTEDAAAVEPGDVEVYTDGEDDYSGVEVAAENGHSASAEVGGDVMVEAENAEDTINGVGAYAEGEGSSATADIANGVTITSDDYAIGVEADSENGGTTTVNVGGDVSAESPVSYADGVDSYACGSGSSATVNVDGSVTATSDSYPYGVYSYAEGKDSVSTVNVGKDVDAASDTENAVGAYGLSSNGGSSYINVNGSVTAEAGEYESDGILADMTEGKETRVEVDGNVSAASPDIAIGIKTVADVNDTDHDDEEAPPEPDNSTPGTPGTIGVRVGGDVTASSAHDATGLSTETNTNDETKILIEGGIKAAITSSEDDKDPETLATGISVISNGEGATGITVKKNVEAEHIGVTVSQNSSGDVTLNIGGDMKAEDGIIINLGTMDRLPAPAVYPDNEPDQGTSGGPDIGEPPVLIDESADRLGEVTVVVEGTVTADNAVTVTYGSPFSGGFDYNWDTDTVTRNDSNDRSGESLPGVTVHVWKVESENPVATVVDQNEYSFSMQTYEAVLNGDTDSTIVRDYINYANENFPETFSGENALTAENIKERFESNPTFMNTYNGIKKASAETARNFQAQNVQYIIRVTNVENSTVSLNGTGTGRLLDGKTYQYAPAGKDIIIMVTAEKGYEVTGVEGGSVTAVRNNDGTYTLRVPEGGGVDIKAVIKALSQDQQNQAAGQQGQDGSQAQGDKDQAQKDKEDVQPEQQKSDEQKATGSNAQRRSYSSDSDSDSGSSFSYTGTPKSSIPETEGTWINNGDGTWSMATPSGTLYTSIWVYSKGNWYYIGGDSLMSTGWKFVDPYWYYFDQNGAMLKGWQNINGINYHLNEIEGRIPVGALLD